MNVGSFIALYAVYQILDDGLANILALETLRHGTNPVNFLGISLFGAQPEQGGKKTGSSNKIFDYLPTDSGSNPTGYFYVIKDTYYQIDTSKLWFPACLGKRLLPLIFSALSGHNLAVYPIDALCDEKSWVKIAKTCVGIFGAVLSVAITPTLKFRFTNLNSFVNDPCAELWAYRTAKKMEVWRIGILGSVITGVNGNWVQRAIEKPWKVLTGIVQISCAITLIAVIDRTT